MPRKRMMHPAFFQSLHLAALPLACERTFSGFWCFADDRGRLLDDAAALWAEVWLRRARECSIADVMIHLDQLVDNGQLCRYQVGGQSFLHVIAWDEHQKISHPTPSKLPPCEDHEPIEFKSWWNDIDTATERWRKAEKVSRTAAMELSTGLRNDSGITPDGLTHSVVKFSSVQVRGDSGSGATEQPESKPRKTAADFLPPRLKAKAVGE